MRTLSPWEPLQEALATRLDTVLTATALAGKIFNYIPEETLYPFMFFGEFETEPTPLSKTAVTLLTTASFQVFSDHAGNMEAQQLVNSVVAGLTSGPLAITGGQWVAISDGRYIDSRLEQEFDGSNVIWVARLRVSFVMQQSY